MRQSRVIELASSISAQAEAIERYLESAGLPPLSFALDTAPNLPPATYGAQQALLEAADELQALVQGPQQWLMSHTSSSARTSIHVILRFGLAHAVPIGDTASFADIAGACDLDEQDVKRILRHAMTYYVFTEPYSGRVAHTPTSRLLAENDRLVAWAKVSLDELGPAAIRLPDALQRWPRSQQPNETGFHLAHGEEDAVFNVLARDPSRADAFADSMKLFVETPPFSLEHTVVNFPWHEANKIVDIGGSTGHASIAIARKNPHVYCVVQDLSQVIEGIEPPPDLRDRVSFMAHDFLIEQPVRDADVYFLRWVLHDWSDLYAIRILRALVPALRAGSKVVLNDSCLPEIGTVSQYQQRRLRGMDLNMKQIQNGRERDPEDWKMLFELVDQRLQFETIVQPQGAALALIVAIWTG